MVREYKKKPIHGPDSYCLEENSHRCIKYIMHPIQCNDSILKPIILSEPERIRGKYISKFLISSESIGVIFWRNKNRDNGSKRYPIFRGYPIGREYSEKDRIIFILDDGKYIPKNKHPDFMRRNNSKRSKEDVRLLEDRIIVNNFLEENLIEEEILEKLDE